MEAMLDAAVAVLRDGRVVACATETQMGLLADAHRHAAVERVVSIKGRGDKAPIALLLPNAEAMHTVARDVPEQALALARAHWPGPLTLVLWAREGLPHAVAPEGKVGVRVPGESTALSLVRAFGRAVTATSANRSGQPAGNSAEEVQASLGEAVDLILPGKAPGGAPSTVVDMTANPPVVLRPGPIIISLSP